jgi:hypothetical protein
MKSKESVKSKPISYERMSVALVLMLEIILVFTFFDYLAHSISPDYAVPSWYFVNKIIYGTIIAFITYLFIKNKPILPKSLILSAVTTVLLQIGYLVRGYPLSFVLLFLVIHFIILFVVSWVAFRVTNY